MSLMDLDRQVWISDRTNRKKDERCESCDKHAAVHEVLFGDGTRFVVCTACTPTLRVRPPS